MFTVKIADHTVAIQNHYAYIEQLCRDYITEEAPQYTVAVTQEQMQRENTDGGNWPLPYLESLAVYRCMVEQLLDEDIVLFHCSALAVDGKAYLFTAPSGTGKSTHARLWRACFGSRVTVINDDKPLLAVHREGVTVYGTPYGGKDNLQTNTSAPVAGIVVLHQAPANAIRAMTCKEAYPMLLNQTYRCQNPQGLIHTMDLVVQLAHLPVFSLGCTISREAVELAWNYLSGLLE